MVSSSITNFSSTLQRLREASGSPSSRAFFLQHGGQRFFGCTYKQYRNVETGRSLPSARLADKLAEALRLQASPPAARRFMEAYLRAMLGSERLVALALDASPRASDSAVDAAMSRVYERPRHLSRAQTEFLYERAENYWAFFILASDSGSWSPENLARVSRLPAAKLARALEGLRRHALATKERDGRWRSPLFEVPIIFSPDAAERPRFHALAEKHLGLENAAGEVLLRHLVLVRASEADLAHYKPILIKALQGAGIFATTEAGADTGLFAIDARVRRVARL